MPDFSTPNKRCIRQYYNKVLIRSLKETFNCNIIYYGLPSPDAEDVEAWIDYISYVVAFQCRDYKKISTPDLPTGEVDKLIQKLNSWESAGKIDGYIVYDGYMEEVIFRGYDNSASGSIDYTHDEHITLFNLDFCNSITSPQDYITKDGEKVTKYKLELIDKILEFQQKVSNEADKFVMFLTISATYSGKDLQDFKKAHMHELDKYNILEKNERNLLILKFFVESNLYDKIHENKYIAQFLPTIFYNGIQGANMMQFAVMCIRPQEIKKQNGVHIKNQQIHDVINTLPICPDPKNNKFHVCDFAVGDMRSPQTNFMCEFCESGNFKMYWNDDDKV